MIKTKEEEVNASGTLDRYLVNQLFQFIGYYIPANILIVIYYRFRSNLFTGDKLQKIADQKKQISARIKVFDREKPELHKQIEKAENLKTDLSANSASTVAGV